MIDKIDAFTIQDSNGDFIFLGERDFVNLSKNINLCFVCLRRSGEETDEHVIPRWAIKNFGLTKGRSISGWKKIDYPRLKIPSCFACNQGLRFHYEDAVSVAFKQGFDAVVELHKSDSTLLLRWLNLLFFKRHYFDLFVRKTPRNDVAAGSLGDDHDWGLLNLHHMMFRAPLYNVRIANKNIGSLEIIRVRDEGWSGPWDYVDDLNSGVILVRAGDVALVACLQDGGLMNSMFKGRFRLFPSADILQVHEVLADYWSHRLNLVTQPEYLKGWDNGEAQGYVRVEVPGHLFIRDFDEVYRHDYLWEKMKRLDYLRLTEEVSVKDLEQRVRKGQINRALTERQKSLQRTGRAVLEYLKKTEDSVSIHG